MGLSEMWEKPWFRWTVIIIVIIILVLAIIVATLREPTVQSAEVTDVTPGAGYVDLDLTLNVKNPNFIGGRLKEIDATVYRGGQPVGPVSLSKEVDVKASTTTFIDVVLRVNNVPNPAGEWDAAGTATIEVFGITFEVPFDTR